MIKEFNTMLCCYRAPKYTQKKQETTIMKRCIISDDLDYYRVRNYRGDFTRSLQWGKNDLHTLINH